MGFWLSMVVTESSPQTTPKGRQVTLDRGPHGVFLQLSDSRSVACFCGCGGAHEVVRGRSWGELEPKMKYNQKEVDGTRQSQPLVM